MPQNFLDIHFNNLRKGGSWEGFFDLITPEQYTEHDRHLSEIHKVKSPPPLMISGLAIHSGHGVYAPDLSGSSFTMIRALLSMYERHSYKNNVLELGAGTGAVSFILKAHKFAEKFTITDVDAKAIEIMYHNMMTNGLDDDFSVLYSDLFSNIYDKFDAIIFNAPLWHKEPHNATSQELALVDVDGVLMKRFLTEAPHHLNNSGEIYFAFSNLCKPHILSDFSHIWDFTLIQAEYISKTGMIKAIYRAVLA